MESHANCVRVVCAVEQAGHEGYGVVVRDYEHQPKLGGDYRAAVHHPANLCLVVSRKAGLRRGDAAARPELTWPPHSVLSGDKIPRTWPIVTSAARKQILRAPALQFFNRAWALLNHVPAACPTYGIPIFTRLLRRAQAGR